MPERTTIPGSQVTESQRLAHAILHLANGLGRLGDTSGAIDEARDLVRKLAFPAPGRAVGFTRVTRTNPDGTSETRERRWAPPPSPAPSCDAPHCDCGEGEDCKANGAAEEQPAWTLTRDHVEWVGDTLKLTDGHRVTQFWIPRATSHDDMLEGMHVLSDWLHGRKPTAPPAPDLAALGFGIDGILKIQGTATKQILDDLVANNAKLDANNAKLEGLCKVVEDALAERLERGPASGTKDDPEVKAAPLALLPAEFHTSGVMGAAFRLQRALGIQASTTSSAAVEAFRQGHVRAWQRRDRNRATYEETDDHVIRRAAEDLIGHLNLIIEGVDWESVDRFKEIAEG